VVCACGDQYFGPVSVFLKSEPKLFCETVYFSVAAVFLQTPFSFFFIQLVLKVAVNMNEKIKTINLPFVCLEVVYMCTYTGSIQYIMVFMDDFVNTEIADEWTDRKSVV